MAKDKSEVKESYALKALFEQFIEENIIHFKHVYRNFNKILFIIDQEHQKPIEIYKVHHQIKRILPKHIYMIVGGETFNDLPHRKKIQELFHVLFHIPESFNGELKPHDIEAFLGEIDLFKKDDGRMYALSGDYSKPDDSGLQKPNKGHEGFKQLRK